MFDDGGGFFTLFIGISFLAPLITIGLVVLGVVAISKADFDPSGRRPYAFYLFAVCFVALFTLVYSAAGVITSLTELVGDDDESAIFFDGSDSESGSSDGSNSSDDFSFDEDGSFDSGSSSGSERGQIDSQKEFQDERDDEIVRTAAQAGAVGLVALGLFAFHWTRGRRMADEPDFAGSPASRVFNAYLYVVCFVAAILILIAGAITVYGLFRVGFPEIAAGSGVTDDAEREGGLRQIASSGVVLAIGFLLALTHWRQMQRPSGASGIRPGPRDPEGPPSGPQPQYAAAGASTTPPPPPPYAPGDTPYQRP